MIWDTGTNYVDYGLYLMGVTLAMIILSTLSGVECARWNWRTWWWNLTEARYYSDEVREAYAIDAVKNEVEAGYKKVHFRHNIHCGFCGRFAKQAAGWAEGMADCKYHGISARFMTHPSQGHVEVIVHEMTPVIEGILEDIPLELTPLWDTERPEIVIDYSPDEDGLPVFTMPIEAGDVAR